jgi:ribosomal protein S27E
LHGVRNSIDSRLSRRRESHFISMDAAENISVDCPGCGKRFTVAARHAGKKGKCRDCGTLLTIPVPVAREAENNLYDIAPAEEARVVNPPPLTVIPGAPVLAYSGPQPRRAVRKGEFDPTDPFEGNKFKNLYVPLTLIVCTAIFNFVAAMAGNRDARMSMMGASIAMVATLAVEIPVMLIACWLAVKFMDAAFGPLVSAVIKLSAIALAPDAVSDAMVLVAVLIGRASGNFVDLAVDVGLGKVIGWVLSLILYFWLFVYFFELTVGEAYRVIIFVWFVRMVFTWMIVMTFLSVWMHR